MLLELARQLIERSRLDSSKPIPNSIKPFFMAREVDNKQRTSKKNKKELLSPIG